MKKPVARLIQGATMIGSDLDEAQCFALLDEVYNLGCNAIDTAHVYSQGNSERILGRWMQVRKLREKIFLVTKGEAHSEDRRRMTPFDIGNLSRRRRSEQSLHTVYRYEELSPCD